MLRLFPCADQRSAPPAPAELELDTDSLATLRYVLDHGLQTPSVFTGYNKIGQFQTASLRVMRPNGRAQRGLIKIYLDRQV